MVVVPGVAVQLLVVGVVGMAVRIVSEEPHAELGVGAAAWNRGVSGTPVPEHVVWALEAYGRSVCLSRSQQPP